MLNDEVDGMFSRQDKYNTKISGMGSIDVSVGVTMEAFY